MIVRIAWLLAYTACIHAAGIGILQEMKYKDSMATRSLYTEEDKVHILTKDNFGAMVYGKPHAWLIEFYNSWCGHCKKFAPTWVEFAGSVSNWGNIVMIGAIDCADDRNNDVCRDMEILAYPTIKFFHEQYTEGAGNFGQPLKKGDTAHELIELLLVIMRSEQEAGRGKAWPDLAVYNFSNAAEIWNDIPTKVEVVFLIFESVDSTVGSELILDMSNATNIKIFRLTNANNLSKILSLKFYPTLFAVDRYSYTPHSISVETSRALLKETIVKYLYNRNIDIPKYYYESLLIEASSTPKSVLINNITNDNIINALVGNTVFQADLETGLRYTLAHEIPRLKIISGKSLDALIKYLKVIINYFPFKSNGEIFVREILKEVEKNSNSLSGKQLSEHIIELEKRHNPVFSTSLNWIGCKGSSPNFRGFTCSLWLIFHTLTVNAAQKKPSGALEVLDAMHNYVKYFFGCADCSEHFQAMVVEKKMESVAENDGAILWLWVAHNEVNYRLAGDPTEDPQYPKKQFPISKHCLKCRDSLGNWDLEQVLMYLKFMYSEDNINSMGTLILHPAAISRATSSYMAILIVLYIYCIIVLFFVLRLFYNKKGYKRKMYAHDTFGKV